MPLLLEKMLADLPDLAAISCSCAVGGIAACGLMRLNPGKTQLVPTSVIPIGTSVVKNYLISVTKPALVTFEPNMWPPPDCCDAEIIALGAAMAFEDNTLGRMAWGTPTPPVMQMLVSFNGLGIITMTTSNESRSHNLRLRAANATMSAYVCLRTNRAIDGSASIVEVGSGTAADFIGMPKAKPVRVH